MTCGLCQDSLEIPCEDCGGNGCPICNYNSVVPCPVCMDQAIDEDPGEEGEPDNGGDDE